MRYDIYGQSVLIANKMESKGIVGNVQISSATKYFLENFFPSEFNFQFNEIFKIESIDKYVESWLVYPE